jgi:hypothetical protein
MTKQIYFLLIICLIFGCQKHEKIDDKIITIKLPKRDKNNIVGFACFHAGSKSEPVKKISEILKNKNYKNLKGKLYNENPAEKYLATIACEKLEKKNLIKLTEMEFAQIKINKTSEEKVTICSGCTNEEELSMKDMFTSKQNFLADSAEEWIIEMIK